MGLEVGGENVAWNSKTWTNYDWSAGGDEWSKPWGGTHPMWFHYLLPRISRFVPAGTILEIAPGFGRCTQFLLGLCERLVAVDLNERCVEACRERFSGAPHLELFANDGRTLPMVEAESIDFAFSWDSLVHAAHDPMRSYVQELARVLKPGGAAFLHHSNFADCAASWPLEPGQRPPGNRGIDMSARAMRDDCRDAGLWCVAQELVPQARKGVFNDCQTLFVKPTAEQRAAGLAETMVVQRDDYSAEMSVIRMIARAYDPSTGPSDAN